MRETIEEEKRQRLEPELQQLEEEALSLARTITALEKFGLTGGQAKPRRLPILGELATIATEYLRGRLAENLFQQDNIRERLGRPRIYTDRQRRPLPLPQSAMR